MALPPPIPPPAPGLKTYIPMTSMVANPIPEKTYTPAQVSGAQIDNPPRTRPVSRGVPSQQLVTVQPFNGLTHTDLLNIRAAMNARLEILVAAPESQAEHIASTKRVLDLANAKLTPTLIPPVAGQKSPVAVGVRPMPPVVSPFLKLES